MNGNKTHRSTRGTASAYAQPQDQQQRRWGRVVGAAIAALVLLFILTSTSTVTDVSSVSLKNLPSKPKLPKLTHIHNPFTQAVHKPPEQSNSSSGDSKWHTDWKWLNPFSSTITLDDTRSVLPPMPMRPPVYTYYDSSAAKDEELKKAEYNLLQIWRRAWWAQGFRPIILGKAEATKNPLHLMMVQKTELYPALEAELLRWLAWGHMGDGILTNYLVLPMAPRDDHDLTYLRRGQYPTLARYEGLGTGIFSGPKNAINTVIKSVLESSKLGDKKSILDADDHHIFELEPTPPSIAYYESSVIVKKYQVIADQLNEHRAESLKSLGDLITSHLHGTFLAANCRDGFNVLIPQAKQSVMLGAQANVLAAALNRCPESPIPNSCPPNNPKCTPCTPTQIKYRSSIHNISREFTIGTVPHPYTQAVLMQGRTPEEVTVSYIRRDYERDPWLEKATEAVLNPGISAYQRIVHFKDWLVTDVGQARGIWHSAERDWKWHELEWRLGFALPGHSGAIQPPEGSDTQYPKGMEFMIKTITVRRPNKKDIVHQAGLFKRAKEELAKTRFRRGPDMRRVTEAWNLADTEAWRFTRAFEARLRMERETWLDEERRYIGGDLEGDRDD